MQYTRVTTAELAKVCHEVNKAYCEGLGDYSQSAWEDSPAWQHESAIAGVEYHINNPEATPADSHISWYQKKHEEGWKYGKVKDPDKKEHPCMVPYDELSKEQQTKDALFIAVVRSLSYK